jgi:hypothetical protein
MDKFHMYHLTTMVDRERERERYSFLELVNVVVGK